MSTEQRKAQYRATYYKNLEANQAKARERSAKKRASHQETPDEAEARRIYNRAHYAKNTGPVRMDERKLKADREHDELVKLVPKTEPHRTIFKMLLIGLLADKEKAQSDYRLKWKKEHYIKKPKPVRVPKPPKEKRVPLTKEERTSRNTAYKKAYEKRKLEQSRQDPEKLAQIRMVRRESNKRWVAKMKAESPDKYAEYVKRQSAKEKARKQSNPQRRLVAILRTKVYVAIRRQQNGFKSANTTELSGCSIEEFMKHLETTWQPGMDWSNLGRGEGKWTMDHIRPCASFDLTIPEQQKLAFHYSNVRAMWFVENCSKGSEHQGRRWRHADHSPCLPAAPP